MPQFLINLQKKCILNFTTYFLCASKYCNIVYKISMSYCQKVQKVYYCQIAIIILYLFFNIKNIARDLSMYENLDARKDLHSND